MSKEKAIEIYKNIKRTLKHLIPDRAIHHKNEIYDHPRIKESALRKKLKQLKEKYKLNKNELF